MGTRQRRGDSGLWLSAGFAGVVFVSLGLAGWWSLRAGDKRDLLVGFGGAAGVAVAGMALVQRRAGQKLKGMLAVASALREAGRGEAAAEVLRVAPDLGLEAEGWNAVLLDREHLAKTNLEQQARLALAGGVKAGRGDLEGACDALAVGLLVVDAQGKVTYANGAAGVMLGAKRDELLEKSVAEVLPERKVAEAASAAAAGTAKQRVALEVERGGAAGEPRGVLRYTMRSLRREDSAAALVTIEDVTQQKVAEQSRNAFVTQVTHELRTPLTNIRLYVDSLIEDGAEDAAARARAINVIGQESRRLERVVSDMLSVAEIEAGAFTLHRDDVRVEEVVREIEENFKAQAQDKEIALEFVLPPKLGVIQADKDKLQLALHNLVGNALKYTPAGGKVKVTVEEEAGGVSIAVADNGIGIKADECDLVFEKFYRAKDNRIAGITGSGLGLALAREVVRMHGGDITVRSQVDRGSTFTIALPAKAA